MKKAFITVIIGVLLLASSAFGFKYEGQLTDPTIDAGSVIQTDANKKLAAVPGRKNVTTAAGLKLHGVTTPVSNVYVTGDITTTEALTFPAGTIVHYTCGAKVTLAHNLVHTSPPVFDGDCQAFVIGAGVATGLPNPVKPEWWGAIPVATKAAATTDYKAAIDAATATGKDVLFGKGWYGTTGGHALSTYGQRWLGSGVNGKATVGGTNIVRTSGTATILTGTWTQTGIGLHDMSFFGNGLAGNLVNWGGHYSTIKNVRGGDTITDYAFIISGANISDMEFDCFDGTYGCVYINKSSGSAYGMLYSKLKMFHGGTTGGYGLYITDAAQSTIEYGGEPDSAAGIYLSAAGGGAITTIKFHKWSLESSNIVEPDIILDATGGNIRNVVFDHGKTANFGGTMFATFALTGTTQTTINDWFATNDPSSTSRSLITMNGATNPTVRNMRVYSNTAYNAIEITGTNTEHPTFENFAKEGSGVATAIWKSSALYARNFPGLTMTFTSGSTDAWLLDGGSVTCTNLGGGIFLGQIRGTITSCDSAITLSPGATTGNKLPDLSLNDSIITAGSGTGITVNQTGKVKTQVYKVTTTYAAFADTDTKKGIVIATLPAKTKIIGVYADTTTKYIGGGTTAATLAVGVTAEDAAEIIASHDVFAAAVTKGLADADMGTGMTRAAQIQGGYLPSWTGTTAVYATLNTTTANTNALTQGSTTFYIETVRY